MAPPLCAVLQRQLAHNGGKFYPLASYATHPDRFDGAKADCADSDPATASNLPLEYYLVDGLNYFQAAKSGALQCMGAFLLGGVEVDAVDAKGPEGGYRALHHAAAAGQVMIIQFLVDNGADVNGTAGASGVTPLMVALEAGTIDAVALLMEHGADPLRCDASGDPALFYGVERPAALHVALRRTELLTAAGSGGSGGGARKAALAAIRNHQTGETLLHAACRKATNTRHGIRYLLETEPGAEWGPNLMASKADAVPPPAAPRPPASGDALVAVAVGDAAAHDSNVDFKGLAPIDAVDKAGRTALMTATRIGDGQKVMCLAGEFGASIHLTDNDGKTALDVTASAGAAGAPIRAYLLKVAGTSSAMQRELISREDASNIPLFLSQRGFLDFLTFLVSPYVLMVSCALYAPGFPAFIATLFGLSFVQIASSYSLKDKNRNLANFAYTIGGHILGQSSIIFWVIPSYLTAAPDSILPTLYYLVSCVAFPCYFASVFSDPGAVRATAADRVFLYQAVAFKGEMAAEADHLDLTSCCRKPIRSKHCSKTHRTVTRFDHFCVWTCNAVGGGNHRAFFFFCLCMALNNILYAYFSFYVLLFVRNPGTLMDPALVSGVATDAVLSNDGLSYMGALFRNLDWFALYPKAVFVSCFLLFTCASIGVTGMMAGTQLFNIVKGLTSNEAWFAARYRWMVTIGNKSYYVQDQGWLRNIIGFFWKDDLTACVYEVPPASEYVRGITKRYVEAIKKAALGDAVITGAGGSQHGHTHSDGSHCDGHHGAPAGSADGDQHFAEKTPLLFADGVTAGGVTAAAHQRPQHEAAAPATSGASALPPAQALASAMQQVAPEKRAEVLLVQSLIQQLIAGSQDLTFPPDVTSAAEKERLSQQARTMFQQYQRMMQMRNATTSAATAKSQ